MFFKKLQIPWTQEFYFVIFNFILDLFGVKVPYFKTLCVSTVWFYLYKFENDTPISNDFYNGIIWGVMCTLLFLGVIPVIKNKLILWYLLDCRKNYK